MRTWKPAKFRKKPVVIEAIKYTEESYRAVREFVGTKARIAGLLNVLLIATLEGEMEAQLGDWIVRGVKGEFYPVKPDIFELTYEAAGVIFDGGNRLGAPTLRAEFAEREKLRPKVVTLCGSTRFMDTFFEAGWAETLAGKIVLSVGITKHADEHGAHGGEALGVEVAAMLDELHKRKIDLSDEILVLNVGGYIGKSTMGEIEYAVAHGKPVRWLEPDKLPQWFLDAKAGEP